jgi:hypothetical protein
MRATAQITKSQCRIAGIPSSGRRGVGIARAFSTENRAASEASFAYAEEKAKSSAGMRTGRSKLHKK